MHDKQQRARRHPLWCAWLVVGLSAAGCSHTSTLAKPKDPLLEAPVAPVPSDAGKPITPSSNVPHSSAGVPPPPTTLAATNNASLAAGNLSLPGARPLAIPEQPAPLASTLKSSPIPAPADPAVQNAPPQVFPVPADTGGPSVKNNGAWAPTSPAVVPASATSVTTENFARLLAERGYVLQHLKQSSEPQGVHVICLASPNGSPEQSQFEVTAPDFDSAGQAILREAERRAGPRR